LFLNFLWLRFIHYNWLLARNDELSTPLML
jgi:hypothetical protein